MNTKELIEGMLYGDTETEEIIEIVKNTDDARLLHIMAINYNYDDGPEIPKAIIDNENCELATALTVFYDCGGYDYLTDGETDEEFAFIAELKQSIVDGRFIKGNIKFTPDLTKVQIFKLKKYSLSEKEYIFVEETGTEEVNERY